MITRTKDTSFLANSSKKFFKVGMAVSILLVIGAFKLPLYTKAHTLPPLKIEEPKDIIYVTQILPIKNEIIPKEAKPIIKSPTVKAVPKIVTVPDDKPLEPIVETPKATISTTSTQVILDPPPVKSSEPVDFVEKMPKFGNGEADFFNYIAKNVYYSPIAVSEGYEGKVYVRFVVNKKGKITNVEIAKGIHPLLDNAAIDVVKNMPLWEAGSQNGENVSVRMVLPINFVIK